MTRIEAAVKAWDHYWGDRYGDEALDEMGEEVAVALAAADAHDRANGIHRIALDDATVELITATLYEHREEALTCYDHDNSWCCVCGEHDIDESWREHVARAVIAALEGSRE